MPLSRMAGSLVPALVLALVSAGAAPKDAPSRIVSGNAYSIPFIDPPMFRLLALPGAASHQAVIEQGGNAWTVDSAVPRLDLAAIRPRIPVKAFTLTLRWLENGVPQGESCGHNGYNTNSVASASLFMLDDDRAKTNREMSGR